MEIKDEKANFEEDFGEMALLAITEIEKALQAEDSPFQNLN